MLKLRARALRPALQPVAAATPFVWGKKGESFLTCQDKRPAQSELGRRLLERFRDRESTGYKGSCRKLHGAVAFSSEYTEADQAASAPWPLVRRPVLETLLKNYAHHPTVVQPLILHGPRGVGKRTLVEGLMKEWNKAPHAVALVNLSSSEEQFTWFEGNHISWESMETGHGGEKASSMNIGTIRYKLEEGLEHLASKAVEKGLLKSDDVLAVLSQDYAVDGALSEFLRTHGKESNFVESIISTGNTSAMWKAAMQQVRNQFVSEFGGDALLNHPGSIQTSSSESGLHMREKPRSQVLVREDAILSLALAQQLFKIHETWRAISKSQLSTKGIIAKVSADAATSYSVLLLRLICGSVQEGKFQPKLIINNLDLMRKAAPENPEDSLHGALYHDSLLMQVSKLGFNHGCIPIILVSSDRCSRITETTMLLYHKRCSDGLPRRLPFTWFQLFLKGQSGKLSALFWDPMFVILKSCTRFGTILHFWSRMLEENSGNAIEDCIDLYLGYLQITTVDPAMEAAVKFLETFAADFAAGKIHRSRLKHGSPWRHPPKTPANQRRWARLQMVDYIEALADADFAINHREERAQEFLEDPLTNALLQVGLFYKQSEPPYLRPITRGIVRCLIRWQVREIFNFSLAEEITYRWHRLIRGRYYRHLIII